MKALIVHGTYGNSKENWFPWLRAELEKRGLEVIVPDFPTPKGQTLENWKKVISGVESGSDTILVGHSLGVSFVLNILEEHEVNSAFLVSGFIGRSGIGDLDKINSDIAERDFSWEKIKKNCHTFVMFHSDNDPYVPITKAYELRDKLDADLIIIPGAGHFNVDAGYTKFEKLKEWILRFTQNQMG